jgi:uncharacterized protein YdiU (UPF0061 family)
LLDWMRERRADYTNIFRSLTDGEVPPIASGDAQFAEWHEGWKARVARQRGGAEAAAQAMRLANPVFIPRNHKVEEALDAAVASGNLVPFNTLLGVVREPYESRDGLDDYRLPMPVTEGPYRTFCGT